MVLGILPEGLQKVRKVARLLNFPKVAALIKNQRVEAPLKRIKAHPAGSPGGPFSVVFLEI
ncbi:MAG TPA: hypothetical protein DEF34_05715 [Desulfotomaculum sp.]|nr:hypothetical protein [Desulfotomaculum sp.]